MILYIHFAFFAIFILYISQVLFLLFRFSESGMQFFMTDDDWEDARHCIVQRMGNGSSHGKDRLDRTVYR